ncbi:unnamed protein product [Schistosoma curassoni]|uniref:Ovule protein n=1 Tax=Schistosoma curassoni TaxID=6186 RepID=A0A183JQ39_9TREM|nr:unnamed protein product [Schistosoma curassoni]
MNQEGEDDESPLNSLLNDVPNYMQPDPIKSKLNSAVKSDKKNIKDDSVNIKKFSSRSSDQHRYHQKNNPNNVSFKSYSYRIYLFNIFYICVLSGLL